MARVGPQGHRGRGGVRISAVYYLHFKAIPVIASLCTLYIFDTLLNFYLHFFELCFPYG